MILVATLASRVRGSRLVSFALTGSGFQEERRG